MSFTVDKANRFVADNAHKVKDQWRPRYHLAGECGWVNDPNGFIQYNGVFHLFYQHYPYDAAWGPMHWGHATSRDLVRWHYQPVALAPDQPYDRSGCFSGSAVGRDGKLCLLYTGHVYDERTQKATQTQCLAFSSDGMHFEKYGRNPVVGADQIPEGISASDFRDPKVIERNGRYYMLVGSHDSRDRGLILLYRSEDLKAWHYVNILSQSDGSVGKGTWECPDLFSLDGKDILVYSPQYMKPRGLCFHNLHASVYSIGSLDLGQGVFEGEEPLPFDWGFDFYAPQVLVDDNGRRILTAWMDMWESPMPTAQMGHFWAGAMILPRELVLSEGRLLFRPVREIEKYRSGHFAMYHQKIHGEQMLPVSGDCYELEAVFRLGDSCKSHEGENSPAEHLLDACVLGLKLRVGDGEETVLKYEAGGCPSSGILALDRSRSGIGPGGVRQADVALNKGCLRLRVFVDKSSVEVFANEGERVMTARIFPKESATGIAVFSNQWVEILSLEKWDLMKEEK